MPRGPGRRRRRCRAWPGRWTPGGLGGSSPLCPGGTGTGDHLGGAWAFGSESYSAPYLGFRQVTGTSCEVGCRTTRYRFHVCDPVFFSTRLRVTMQALGWRSEGRFLPLRDDISSVAYWYQTLPGVALPSLPDRDALEVI